MEFPQLWWETNTSNYCKVLTYWIKSLPLVGADYNPESRLEPTELYINLSCLYHILPIKKWFLLPGSSDCSIMASFISWKHHLHYFYPAYSLYHLSVKFKDLKTGPSFPHPCLPTQPSPLWLQSQSHTLATLNRQPAFGAGQAWSSHLSRAVYPARTITNLISSSTGIWEHFLQQHHLNCSFDANYP